VHEIVFRRFQYAYIRTGEYFSKLRRKVPNRMAPILKSPPSLGSLKPEQDTMRKFWRNSLLLVLGWSAEAVPFVLPVAVASWANAQVGQFPELVLEAGSRTAIAALPPTLPPLDGATVLRQRQVVLQRDLLESNWSSLHITPFPGVTAVARVVKIDRERDDAFIWIAQIEGDQAGSAVFSMYDDMLLGVLRTEDRVFWFHSNASGTCRVSELAPSNETKQCGGGVHGSHAHAAPSVNPQSIDSSNTANFTSGRPELDLMVVYTPRALSAAGSYSALRTRIGLEVGQTNLAYINSNANAELRLVTVVEQNYDEGPYGGTLDQYETHLTRLSGTSDGYLDQVHALRDAYGADLVSLIVEDVGSTPTGSSIGLAYFSVLSGPVGNEGLGFSILSQGWLGSGSLLAHEVGHNLGLHHDRAHSTGTPSWPWAYGYNTPIGGYKTVMYYAIGSFFYFSNPNVSFGSVPLGVANSEDNVRAINSNAPIVSAYRQRTPVAGGPETDDNLGSSCTSADFNGDGYADLAIGVPNENPTSSALMAYAGAVNILYGGPTGLTASGNRFLSQDDPADIPGTAEGSDWFGTSLAAGDFNGDGYADLAIGVRGENVSFLRDAGAVNILYGSASGLGTANAQIWDQSTAGVPGDPEEFDYFGEALAVGDFDADGFADLAVGVPGEDIGGIADAGSVYILYGSTSGLGASGAAGFDQDNPAIAGAAEDNDRFGHALAVGDFDADGYDDLAVGSPTEDVDADSGCGVVDILYGSSAGLRSTGSIRFDQDSPGIPGARESGDAFGWSLASGDFNGNGFDDLAVGAPFEAIGALANAGGLTVIYGSAAGLTSTGAQGIDQDSTNVPGTAEAGDRFGWALTSADFNGNGRDDLAIGVDGEAIGSQAAAGAVNVLFGGTSALVLAGSQVWDQDAPGVPEVAQSGDRFGYSLTAGDFNNDGQQDLVAGVPYESVAGIAGAGAVTVLVGPLAGSAEFWNQYSESPSMTMSIGPLCASGPTPITITHGRPNAMVRILASRTGGGPVHTEAGFLLLSSPIRVLKTMTLNHTGAATGTFGYWQPLPVGTSMPTGVNVWLQAYDVANRVLSNGITTLTVNCP
jgi:hypothetical protein